ncbi:MAG: hypothetical protein ACREBU_20495 [Nitrososphaera sp.]
MKFTSKRYRWLIVLGVATVAASLLFKITSRTPFQLTFDLFWVGIGIGVACMLGGIFLKKEVMMLHVIGVPKSPEFQGERKDLDALFKTVREEKDVDQLAGTESEGS